MLFFYDFAIRFYNFLIYIFHFFNPKAELLYVGRNETRKKISLLANTEDPCIWFHFASLGEFEQGRPVLEELRKRKAYKIVITFFSPSGYELRKNYTGADYIFYLPSDTRNNASKFLNSFNIKFAVFTKYEYWYHYFNQLERRSIPLYIISGIFRNDQTFFKWYGGLHRKMLRMVAHFFVQDAGSLELLKSFSIQNATVSGDTRFDRVAENASAPKTFPDIENFCANHDVFVGGSTWPEDERIIGTLIKQYPNWKFIIAPHEIKEEKIKNLISLLPEGLSVRYSNLKSGEMVSASRLLIIDNIGMLSSLYQYGKIAYIGGGFGVGIHNTLEAAAYGVPVIFGPNYQKFLEAKALIANGAGFTIASESELLETMAKLQNEELRSKAAKAAAEFVQNQTGATKTILSFLEAQGF